MFACLHINLEKEIKTDNQKFDSLITIEDIRDNIIKLTNDEPLLIKNVINNNKNTMPYIIYSKPYKNQIRIFAMTENGKLALNSIFMNLLQVGTLKIKNEYYKIKGIPQLDDEVSFLPYNNGRINIYTTLTPINIFNRHNMKIYSAIMKKYFPNSMKYKDGTVNQQKAFNNELKIYVNSQIKDYMKYMLSKLIKDKNKEDFEFIDNIKIEWEELHVRYDKYHTEERVIPMITGKFKSDFILPKFIGYKIGKGFGELSLKTRG